MRDQENGLAQKRRGPKPTTGKGLTVGVRCQKDVLAALDAARAAEPDQPSRADMLRRAAMRYLQPGSRPAAQAEPKPPPKRHAEEPYDLAATVAPLVKKLEAEGKEAGIRDAARVARELTKALEEWLWRRNTTVHAEVMKRTAERQKELDGLFAEARAEAKRAEEVRKGLYTGKEYKLLLAVLHPDNSASPERRAEAFRLIKEKELLLVIPPEEVERSKRMAEADLRMKESMRRYQAQEAARQAAAAAKRAANKAAKPG